MALARAYQTKPIEFNLPVLQAPLELQYQAITGFQSEKDSYDAMSQTTPRSRTIDEPWRQEYSKYVQDLTENVTQAFASGNVDYAMKSLRKAKTNVADLWKPGGLAYALEEGAITEASEIAKIQEARKDDPTGAGNLIWALKQFKAGQQPLNYDYDTGKYNRVGQAELFNYVDKEKILLDLAKAADPDMTEQDIVSGNWIVRLKEKGVSEERIQGLFQSFLQRPEVQSQLEIDFFNQYGVDFNDLDVDFSKLDWQNLSPDDSAKLGFITASMKDVQDNTATTKGVYNKMDASEKQQYLKQLGFYKGNVDGEFGKLSKEAEQHYMAYLDKQTAQDLQTLQTNPKSYFVNEVAAEPSRQLFYNLFGKEYSRTLKANPFALANLKYQQSLKLQERVFQLDSAYNPGTYNNAVITPSQAVEVTATLDKMRKDEQSTITNSNNYLNTLIRNPNVQAATGDLVPNEGTKALLAQALQIYEEAQNAPDPAAAFKQALESSNLGLSFTGDADKLFGVISTNASDLKQAYSSAAQAKDRLAQIQAMEVPLLSEVDAAGKYSKGYNSQLPKGTTQEEFWKLVVRAKDMTPEEIGRDPQLKIFLNSPEDATYSVGYPGPKPNVNNAKAIYDKAIKEVSKNVQSGNIPKSLPSFTLTSTDPKWGIGKANNDLALALLNTREGFFDAVTGSQTKWNRVDKSGSTKVADIDFTNARIVIKNSFGKPVLQVTTKEDGVFNVDVATTGNQRTIIDNALKEEWATAVNKNDEEGMNLFGKMLHSMRVEEGEMVDAGIVANNRNGIDAEKNPVFYNGTPLPETYTVVSNKPVHDEQGNEYNYNIITWGSGGNQRWAIANPAGQMMGPVKILNSDMYSGVIFDQGRKSISEASYTNYMDALTAIKNVELSMTIPIEQTLQQRPKGTPEEFGNARSSQMNFTESIIGSLMAEPIEEE